MVTLRMGWIADLYKQLQTVNITTNAQLKGRAHKYNTSNFVPSKDTQVGSHAVQQEACGPGKSFDRFQKHPRKYFTSSTNLSPDKPKLSNLSRLKLKILG